MNNKMLMSMATSAFLVGLTGCERPAATPGSAPEPEARAEANLEKARQANAETYAPALYGAAVEALEKGVSGEEGLETEGAEALAARSMEEAIRVREEAKEAAQRALRSSNVLCSVVETILSRKPARRERFPTDARLAELKRELDLAREAFEAGDFAVAGWTAQNVESELRGSGQRPGT